jgi:uncharacterized membrane protein
MKRFRAFARLFLALLFIVAGVTHLVAPAIFVPIMPPYLLAPQFLVYVSGVAEIIGGAGLFISRFQVTAGWGLILLLIAVFPANIYALQNGMVISGHPVPHWILLLRLPFQAVIVYGVYWSSCKRPPD